MTDDSEVSASSLGPSNFSCGCPSLQQHGLALSLNQWLDAWLAELVSTTFLTHKDHEQLSSALPSGCHVHVGRQGGDASIMLAANSAAD